MVRQALMAQVVRVVTKIVGVSIYKRRKCPGRGDIWTDVEYSRSMENSTCNWHREAWLLREREREKGREGRRDEGGREGELERLPVS